MAGEFVQIYNLIKRRMVKLPHTHHDMTHAHQEVINPDYLIEQMDNGLVRSSGHYYAIARDELTGNIVIYFSRGQDFLKTHRNALGYNEFIDDIKDENGNIVPNAFRYHLPPLPPYAGKKTIREAIEKHAKSVEEETINKYRLAGGNASNSDADTYATSDYDEDAKYPYANDKFLVFRNKEFGVSVHHTPGGKYNLQFHGEFHPIGGGERFVEANALRNKNKGLLAGLTSTRFIDSFDTEEEALAYAYIVANHRTQRTWRGQNANPLTEDFLTNSLNEVYDFTSNELENRENVDEGEFDSIFTIGGSVLLGTKFIFSFTFVKAVSAAVLAGFGMRKFLAGYLNLKREYRWWREGIKSVYPESGRYMLDDKDNVRRIFNRKPPSTHSPYINVLKVKNEKSPRNIKNITRNGEKLTSHKEKNWKERWLLSYNSKTFGGFSSQIDENTSTDFSFNGLVRLTHRCPDTDKLISYVQYVEALDINDKISIPKEIKTLLKKNPIYRVSQDTDKKIYAKDGITKEAMIDDACPRFFSSQTIVQQKHRDIAAEHISWLFNERPVSDGEDLVPIKKREQPNTHNSEEWTGFNQHAELMRRYFGDDWEEMESTFNKAKGLTEFFKGAVFPSLANSLREHRKRIASPRAREVEFAAAA